MGTFMALSEGPIQFTYIPFLKKKFKLEPYLSFEPVK